MDPHVIEWRMDMPTRYMELKTEKSGRGLASFEWSGDHDLWQFKDRMAFESCDFSRATVLSSISGYVFKGDVGTYYFGCSVYGHCSAGQKLMLDITDDEGNTGSCHGPACDLHLLFVGRLAIIRAHT